MRTRSSIGVAALAGIAPVAAEGTFIVVHHAAPNPFVTVVAIVNILTAVVFIGVLLAFGTRSRR